MVLLEFQVEVEGQFESVWKYFSQFQNVPDWDSNTKSCTVIKKNINEVGSIYDIVSVFNGKASTVTYETIKFEQTNEFGSISLAGKNSMITADDEIICKKKGPKTTIVIYRADICLRHIFCICTPCVKGSLGELQVIARTGCVKKSIQKWGKAK